MVTSLEVYDRKQISHKLDVIRQILNEKKVLVAYSGGVDSSVVALLAKKYAKEVILIMQIGLSVGLGEKEFAEQQAKQLDLPLEFVEYDEIDHSQEYASNPSNRCYYCKQILHEILEVKRKELGFDLVLSGTNISDLKGHRPGHKAQQEAGVVNPLVTADITKQEVRWIATEEGLNAAKKPATACLASRFITGVPITKEGLKRVALAEDFLKTNYDLSIVRVRDHGDIARIEVGFDEMNTILDQKIFSSIHQRLIELGFRYVSLDLRGYRPSVPPTNKQGLP